MFSLYFSPSCVKPAFLNDKENVRKCWLLDGIGYSLLFTFILIIVNLYAYSKRVGNVNIGIVWNILIFILIWSLLPILFWYSGGNLWSGYQSIMSDLISSGFTKQEAISFIQGLDNFNKGTSTSVSPLLSKVVFGKDKEERRE